MPPDACCPVCGAPLVSRIEVRKLVATLPIVGKNREVVEKLAEHFGQPVAIDRLVDWIWGERDDGGPLSARKILHVMIYQVRPRLAAHGLIIESYGRGGSYRLRWAFPEEWRKVA